MSVQQEFCKALLGKRIELKKEKKVLNSVSMSTIGRWQNEDSSPTLQTVEDIFTKNNIELPFFFDGKVESLMEYNKKIGAKMGFKLQLIFE